MADTHAELQFIHVVHHAPLQAMGTGSAQLMVLDKTMDATAAAKVRRSELGGFMFGTIPDHGDPVMAERDCVVCAGSVAACKTDDVDACSPLQDCLLQRGHDTRVSYCLRER
jgi:hypothetical protein